MKSPTDRNAFPLLKAALAIALGMALVTTAMAHGKENHTTLSAKAGAAVLRSEVALQMPAVKVVRQDGVQMDFKKAIDDGRPVMLNFVYTSCTAICPVTTQVFGTTRYFLGDDRDAIHVVSVSIDPDYDTVPKLAEYAERFSTGGAWSFFTASQADSIAIQKAFKTFQGDKMNHVPVTYLRAAPGEPWVRLDGFASPNDLVKEINAMKGVAVGAHQKSQSTMAVKAAALSQ